MEQTPPESKWPIDIPTGQGQLQGTPLGSREALEVRSAWRQTSAELACEALACCAASSARDRRRLFNLDTVSISNNLEDRDPMVRIVCNRGDSVNSVGIPWPS